jgi:hypothetical protein
MHGQPIVKKIRKSVTTVDDGDNIAILERSGAESQLRQAPFPFTFLTVGSSLIIQPFDAVQCESQTASLNRQRKAKHSPTENLALKGIQG